MIFYILFREDLKKKYNQVSSVTECKEFNKILIRAKYFRNMNHQNRCKTTTTRAVMHSALIIHNSTGGRTLLPAC